MLNTKVNVSGGLDKTTDMDYLSIFDVRFAKFPNTIGLLDMVFVIKAGHDMEVECGSFEVRLSAHTDVSVLGHKDMRALFSTAKVCGQNDAYRENSEATLNGY
jgi:hypothetical protein